MEDFYTHERHEQGHSVYKLDGRLPDADSHPESDLAAIRERFVSITPLRFDMTDHRMLGLVGEWRWPGSFG